MLVRATLVLTALFVGGWMVFDAIHVRHWDVTGVMFGAACSIVS